MKIILSPTAAFSDDTPPTVQGETITYRGETYDLSQLPDGGEVEAESPFAGTIKRVDGVVHLTLQFEYNMEKAEDSQSTDWSDYTFDVTDGECPNPIKYKPEPEIEAEEVEEESNDD